MCSTPSTTAYLSFSRLRGGIAALVRSRWPPGPGERPPWMLFEPPPGDCGGVHNAAALWTPLRNAARTGHGRFPARTSRGGRRVWTFGTVFGSPQKRRYAAGVAREGGGGAHPHPPPCTKRRNFGLLAAGCRPLLASRTLRTLTPVLSVTCACNANFFANFVRRKN